MFRNYLITAVRNLRKNKTHSFLNISGLSVGMAVAILIGLWVWDELSFDKYHDNYDSIAEVMQSQTYNGVVGSGGALPVPMEAQMRKDYGSSFTHMAMVSWNDNHVLSAGDKNIAARGTFMGKEAPEMFTLHMLKGSRNALQGTTSMFISESVAKAMFGNVDVVGKLLKLDNGDVFKVTGVYEDLPLNTTFHEVSFFGPWDYYTANVLNPRTMTDWTDNSWMLYVQVAPNISMNQLSQKIKNIKINNCGPEEAKTKPVIFLQPMSRWHLYSTFKNGVNVGGAISYVWLFGIIGGFVLLLACINFMNLSTARSEKRTKEVGIRKAVGSLRSQLITQFFCESMLMAVCAFCCALAIVELTLPFFNQVAGKQMNILWSNPVFWCACAGFTLFTGVVAGSYPALYLSSFNPVKVLKGAFKAGRFAALPRKVLVVVQFSVSVLLIIGTIVVFKQIQFAKSRPIGYSRAGLIYIDASESDDLLNHFSTFKTDLISSGFVANASESSSPTTSVNNNRGDVTWQGMDPAMVSDFANIRITTEFGPTVGWQVVAGRDFSSALKSDSSAIIINEAAVKYMGLKNPIGETIRFGSHPPRTVIGVVKNMVMSSPYEPVKQTLFYIANEDFGFITLRLNPNANAHDAVAKIESICKKYSPTVPFSYKFADDEYARKFATEERIGSLASVFATLAIFISCLGLFGMATFMAEQRIKEIGVRKVLGASVLNLWGLLSKDFVVLVVISLLIAMPTANYFMGNWLQHFEYHSNMPWWVFAASGLGAIVLTLLTVSYQSIKAARANPINSLKTE